MEQTRKRTIWIVLAALIVLAVGTVFALLLLTGEVPEVAGQESGEGRLIYIDRDDTADSVKAKSDIGWRWDIYSKVIGFRPRTGRYRVVPGTKYLELYRCLRSGNQEPIKLVIPTSRNMDRLAAVLSQNLMVDSAEIASALTDSMYLDTHGYTTATIPALFIPNTYEVYWDISVDKFMERMEREHNRFWTAERKAKAEALGMTREQVATLASIVDEETANNAEKPMIAGLYLNRLERGIPLQADPTVKFALGDFTLRRILNVHLGAESPYNTYRNVGLPPGPIRIASIAGLEAVLNPVRHNYLYMCAKEDFSGTHNFASTLPEHYSNARRYQKALNKRGIR